MGFVKLNTPSLPLLVSQTATISKMSLSLPLLVPRCCDEWRSGICGNAARCPLRLYAEVRAKPELDYKTRKALLSHWSPRVAKAICHAVYPDFRGTYEQHLWLLTHKAAQGASVYAREAEQKGVKFLWPYQYTSMLLCGPSHYLYYVLRWERPQVNVILGGPSRYSVRLNNRHLSEALLLNEVYMALCRERKEGFEGRQERNRALEAAVKKQMMLSADNLIEFKAIAYGWTHLREARC